jgi:precorrin-2 dehydrogenase/sirohydrochlorin ferrochelatase
LNRLYPMFVRAQGLRCVVIGGGAVALRKARGLLDAGADVTVIAPEVQPDLCRLVDDHAVRWIQREAHEQDLDGANLVFLATDSAQVNAQLEQVARHNGSLVNRADSPLDGTFHVPAVVRRDDITVAVSTSGRSPAFARLLREELDTLLTEERLALLEVIAEARESVRGSHISKSGDQWRELMHDASILAHVRAGRRAEAVRTIVSRLEATALSGSRK